MQLQEGLVLTYVEYPDLCPCTVKLKIKGYLKIIFAVNSLAIICTSLMILVKLIKVKSKFERKIAQSQDRCNIKF